MTAEYKVHGDVAVITLNNPPVNGLGYETRLGITDGLARANADAAVKAIVLTGAGKAFSGGADIREFGSPKALQEPNLLSVIQALEHSEKPVVAAIHTVCMGGGWNWRWAATTASPRRAATWRCPKSRFGLIPGAGGTQRLPRVLGVEAALNMIVSGEPVKSEMLAMLPGQKLFDKMATSAEALPAEALALALEMAAKHADGSSLPLVRNLPCKHPLGDAYFQFARNMVKGMSKNFPAPAKCVDAVEAATTKKFDDGMAYERELFINLMWTPECRRCATPSPPNVRPARSPTCRKTRRSAHRGGGGHRRRHHGRRHQHELPERRHSGEDAGDEAGGAGPGRRHHPQELRSPGQEGQAQAGQVRAAHGAAEHHAELRRPGGRRPGDRSGVRGDGRQGKGVQELDRVMKPGAILASNTSTLDVNHRQLHEAPAGRGRHCISSARPT
jgi:3-hydroxyacyl-CoA dehydrogenase